MTIWETTIAKLHQLPDSLLQEVDDFIDFVVHKHQFGTADTQSSSDTTEA